jgi:phosphatidylethanolamine-binding protein (PEBP) family uncharacterized protein
MNLALNMITALEPLKIFCDINGFASGHDLPEKYLSNQDRYFLTDIKDADIAIFPDFETMNKLSPKGKESLICICADNSAGTSWNTKNAHMQFIHCSITNLPSVLRMAERSLAPR